MRVDFQVFKIASCSILGLRTSQDVLFNWNCFLLIAVLNGFSVKVRTWFPYYSDRNTCLTKGSSSVVIIETALEGGGAEKIGITSTIFTYRSRAIFVSYFVKTTLFMEIWNSSIGNISFDSALKPLCIYENLTILYMIYQ